MLIYKQLQTQFHLTQTSKQNRCVEVSSEWIKVPISDINEGTQIYWVDWNNVKPKAILQHLHINWKIYRLIKERNLWHSLSLLSFPPNLLTEDKEQTGALENLLGHSGTKKHPFKALKFSLKERIVEIMKPGWIKESIYLKEVLSWAISSLDKSTTDTLWCEKIVFHNVQKQSFISAC